MKNLFLHTRAINKIKGFSLDKWLKNLLTKLNVTFADDCCPCDSSYAPMQWNNQTEQLEYYDCDTKSWTYIDCPFIVVEDVIDGQTVVPIPPLLNGRYSFPGSGGAIIKFLGVDTNSAPLVINARSGYSGPGSINVIPNGTDPTYDGNIELLGLAPGDYDLVLNLSWDTGQGCTQTMDVTVLINVTA